MRKGTLVSILIITASVTCSTSALAQGAEGKPRETAASAQEVPPALRLGARVTRRQELCKVIPELVLVEGAGDYLEAIASWTPQVRFPVMIDDGSAQSAEDIGRFTRAFKPTRIVRWRAQEPAHGSDFRAIPREAIQGALNRAWGRQPTTSSAELVSAMRTQGHVPMGVVALRAGDPAWAGGVALAASRGQAMIFIDSPESIDGVLSVREADDLAARIESEVDALGVKWRGLGDEIDALTISMNTPAKIDKGGGEYLAATDRLGRLGNGVEVPERWAWAGQVHGSARESVYRAMCALFLTQDSAWLFDGYPSSGPWAAYDVTRPAETLRDELGFRIEAMDEPRQSAHDWRMRAARPLDFDVVFINTKGNADFFDLEKGTCKPGDVPLLTRPCAVHIIHSWSALFPGVRHLLAGKWMERGAYFYVGSVHEPYLSAFLPTGLVSARMFSGAAWGAAVRHDSGPAWKVAVFGDPLCVYTRGHPSQDGPVPLKDVEPIDATLRDDLKESRFEPAFRTLLIQGRDEQLVKLAVALLAQKKGELTPAAAELAVPALLREGKPEALRDMFMLLDRGRASRAELRDALWLASYPLTTALPESWMNALRVNLRPENIGRDATTLAARLFRDRGKDASDEFLRSVRDGLSDKAQIDALDAAAKRPVSEWGR